MKKFFKLIANVVAYTIFILMLIAILLLIIYVINVKVMAKNNKISQIPYNFYIIASQSMYPTIKAGDMIMTYKLDNYEVGDVITFVSDSKLSNGVVITHRIKSVRNGKYETQGDANSTPDTSLVSYDKVIGKVLLKVPKIGFLQEFMATRQGWIIIVLIPCLAIIAYDILKIMKNIYGKSKKTINNKVVNNINVEISNKEKDNSLKEINEDDQNDEDLEK